MLKRIYIDNYKAFSNFTFEPCEIQLIYGRNGVGKTSLFEALDNLRSFVIEGMPTEQIFSASCLTRWDRRTVQSFELEVDGNGGRYFYRLEIDHLIAEKRSRVLKESLTFDGRPLFLDEVGELKLFRDDHTEGATYSLNWSISGLGTVPARKINTKLTWFKGWLERAYFLHLNPFAMKEEADDGTTRLVRDGTNFASWYRHVSQEMTERLPAYFKDIEDVLGFNSLALPRVGKETRALRAILPDFASRDAALPGFGFEELSDGQRILIVLFALLHFTVEPGAFIALDDPVSFVALAEIQPFIISLVDKAEEIGAQILLISHHPEVLDYLAPDDVIRFDRDPTGPVRILGPIDDKGSGLRASELVARGWDDE